MMSEEMKNQQIEQKQIEEMAYAICGAHFIKSCRECPIFQGYKYPCVKKEFAEKFYNVGYRKQSDTVREFVGKVLKIGSKRPLCVFNEYGEGYIDCIENIKKIAKEYGVEVKE